MDTKKEETIAELYALRAGLSVVSKCADEVKDYENDLAELDKNIADGKAVIELSEKEYKQKLEECTKMEQRENFSVYINNSGAIVKAFFIMLGIAMGIASLVMFAFSTGKDDSNRDLTFGIIWAVAIGVPLLILAIILICRHIVAKAKSKQLKIQHEEDLQQKQAEVQDFKLSIDKSCAELSEAVSKSEKTRKDCLQVIKNKVEEFKVYDKALVNQYGKLITTADWENVDLIIFYLESGRADTMKEALQLVDKRRQVDEIVEAIEEANERICYEISNGFAKMGVAMGRCFSELSKQISVQHQEVLASLKENNIALKNISSSVELNNALQAKANVTSDQLKDDFIYMQKKMGIIS